MGQEKHVSASINCSQLRLMLAAAVLVNYLICYKLLTQESMLDKTPKVKKKKKLESEQLQRRQYF